MEYTITNIDTEKNVVTLNYKLRNGDTGVKRMMANLSSKEALAAQIEQWLVQHSDNVEAEIEKISQADVTSAVNKKVTITSLKEESIKAELGQ